MNKNEKEKNSRRLAAMNESYKKIRGYKRRVKMLGAAEAKLLRAMFPDGNNEPFEVAGIKE